HLVTGGDQVLIDLAKVLSASVRTVDTVGRMGGDEFMVLAPETTLDGANQLGERICAAVEHFPFIYKRAPIRVTVSVGFAAVVGVPAGYDQLKHLAAAALAEAKANGGNRRIIRALR
ncbi:MAG TPA: GGDEF domain-containing protein, partial [Gemmataceae bacterium]|nr:GGDEF domain-containing protein [Gemmataceae bacterium]